MHDPILYSPANDQAALQQRASHGSACLTRLLASSQQHSGLHTRTISSEGEPSPAPVTQSFTVRNQVKRPVRLYNRGTPRAAR